MAISIVGICNMALGNIGVTQTIENIDDNNERSRVCKLYYQSTLEQLVRRMQPNFAQAFVALALVSGDAPPGWKYQYRYPTDALFARRITDVSGARQIAISLCREDNWHTIPEVPFSVLADQGVSGRIIVTDQPDAVLWYTKRISDPNDFDPEFVIGFSWALAAAIAIPMKVSANIAQFAANNARQMLGEAQVGSKSETQVQPDLRQSPSVTGRW